MELLQSLLLEDIDSFIITFNVDQLIFILTL